MISCCMRLCMESCLQLVCTYGLRILWLNLLQYVHVCIWEHHVSRKHATCDNLYSASFTNHKYMKESSSCRLGGYVLSCNPEGIHYTLGNNVWGIQYSQGCWMADMKARCFCPGEPVSASQSWNRHQISDRLALPLSLAGTADLFTAMVQGSLDGQLLIVLV